MERPRETEPGEDADSRSTAPRLVVRPAAPADRDAVLRLLRDLELDYAERDLGRFVVGEMEGARGREIVGIAEVRVLDGLALLSCVGVRADLQGRGLGRELVAGALQGVREDVYLYTLVPGFFETLGFAEAPTAPQALPPREIYGCASCEPSRCRRLVRRGDGR